MVQNQKQGNRGSHEFPDLSIRSFIESDETAVIELWNICGLVVPSNDPQKDIRRKTAVGRDLFIVGEVDGRLVSTVMGGYEGHRGWVNYLAVHPDSRRRGFGGIMMRAVEERLMTLGCPKLNLQVRETNISTVKFYESIGFLRDEVVSYGKRLISDESAN